MTDEIRSITIIHPVEIIKEYRCFSEFFRLIGILVCENIFEEKTVDETDFTIQITPSKKDKISWENIQLKYKGESEYYPVRTDGEVYVETNWLNAILNAMKPLFDTTSFAEICSVAQAYVDNDLMRGELWDNILWGNR